MDLSKTDLFIDAITKYLKLNQPFMIIREKKGISWDPAYTTDSQRDIESIQIFSDYLTTNLALLDFRALSDEYFYKIRALVDLLERFIKNQKKKHQHVNREVFEEAEAKILALRLGGKITWRNVVNMNPELYQFIKRNKLDLKMFALGVQLKPDLAISFEVDAGVYKELHWEQLERQKLSDATGRYYGYRFFYEGQLIMETDLDFLLTSEFSFLYPGITFYHPKKALHIAALDKREPTGMSTLEFVTKSGKNAPFLMLQKENGNVYCIGVEKGKISAPSDDYFKPYQCRYKIEISGEEFESIFGQLENDKFYKTDVSENRVLEVVCEKLELEPFPEKKLVTRHKVIAYFMLPYALIKFFCSSRKYPGFKWKDVLKEPHKVSTINRKMLTSWLEKTLLVRGGEERCFE